MPVSTPTQPHRTPAGPANGVAYGQPRGDERACTPPPPICGPFSSSSSSSSSTTNDAAAQELQNRPESAPPSCQQAVDQSGANGRSASLTPSSERYVSRPPLHDDGGEAISGRSSSRRSSFRRLKKAGSVLLRGRSTRSSSKMFASSADDSSVRASSTGDSGGDGSTADWPATGAAQYSPMRQRATTMSGTFPTTASSANATAAASGGRKSSPRGSVLSSSSSTVSSQHGLSSPRADQFPSSPTYSSRVVDMDAMSADSMSLSSTQSPSSSRARIPQAPGLVGIANHGNTCFMNAVVQCLSNTEPLCRYFTLDSYKLSRTKRTQLHQQKLRRHSKAGSAVAASKESQSASGQLRPGAVTDRLALLLKAMWSNQYESNVSQSFCQTVGFANDRYRLQTQQDAHEFLTWLLNTMDGDLQGEQTKRHSTLSFGSMVRRKSFSAKSEQLNTSYIQNLFLGMSMSTLKCTCGYISASPDPFMCLSLPLPGNHGVRKVIVQVIFRSHARRPLQIGLLVPKVGESDETVTSVLKEVCGRTSLPASHVLLCSIRLHSFGNYHLPGESVDTVPELIFAFETPSYASTVTSSQLMSVSTHASDQPDASPGIHRGSDTVFSGSSCGGTPHRPSLTDMDGSGAHGTVFLSSTPEEQERRRGSQFSESNLVTPNSITTGGRSKELLSPPDGYANSPARRSQSQRSHDSHTQQQHRHGGSPQGGGTEQHLHGQHGQQEIPVSNTSSYANLPAGTSGTQDTWLSELTIEEQGQRYANLPLSEIDHSETAPDLDGAMDDAASPQFHHRGDKLLDQNADNRHDNPEPPVTVVVQGSTPRNSKQNSASDVSDALSGGGGGSANDAENDSAIGSLCDGGPSQATTPGAATSTIAATTATLDGTYVNMASRTHAALGAASSTTAAAVDARGDMVYVNMAQGQANSARRDNARTPDVKGVYKHTPLHAQDSSGGGAGGGGVSIIDDGHAPPVLPRSQTSLPERLQQPRMSQESTVSGMSGSGSPSFARKRPSNDANMAEFIGLAGGNGNSVPKELRDNSRLSMEANSMYRRPIMASTSSNETFVRNSLVIQESLLVLVLLVEGTAHEGTRFGSPMVLRVRRDIKYVHLHSIIVKHMQRYLDKPISKKMRSTLMFRLRVQGGHPGQSYLSPEDHTPLYSKTVDVALRSLPTDIPQKHIRIITEWTKQTRSKLCLLAEEMPDVHHGVRDVEDSMLKQSRCTLSDCLAKYTQPEQLYGDYAWHCPRCDKASNGSVKRLTITQLPKVLIVHVKRFQHVGKHHMKADTFMDFPVDLLDMQPYTDMKSSPTPMPKRPHSTKQQQRFMDRPPSVRATAIRYVNIEAIETHSGVPSTKYKLIGLVNHVGQLNRGHYMAVCRSVLTNHWYSYDDSKVVPTEQDKLVTRDAFLLFYQRLDLLQPVHPLDWIKQIDVQDLVREHGPRQHRQQQQQASGAGQRGSAPPPSAASPSRLSMASQHSTATKVSATMSTTSQSAGGSSVQHIADAGGDALDLAAASVSLPVSPLVSSAASPSPSTTRLQERRRHLVHTETAL
eukprot:scpid10603/ scgid1915/ Ubiquitin carboxyl-terminal hydrolase 43; Deubiquitinating enzyme 43; Ubiquitin thioesterase 43; Ubiquitin-specific-processing protease 43